MSTQSKRKQEAESSDPFSDEEEVDKPPRKQFKAEPSAPSLKPVAESSPSLNKHNTRSESPDEIDPAVKKFFKDVEVAPYPYIMRLFKEQQQHIDSSSSKIITNLKKMYPSFSALSHEDINSIFGESVALKFERRLEKATLARMKWETRETGAIADILEYFCSYFEFMETGSLS